MEQPVKLLDEEAWGVRRGQAERELRPPICNPLCGDVRQTLCWGTQRLCSQAASVHPRTQHQCSWGSTFVSSLNLGRFGKVTKRKWVSFFFSVCLFLPTNLGWQTHLQISVMRLTPRLQLFEGGSAPIVLNWTQGELFWEFASQKAGCCCLPDPVSRQWALEQSSEATGGKRLERLWGFLQSSLRESVRRC